MIRALFLSLTIAAPLAAQPSPEMEVRLVDGSRVKLVLFDQGLPLVTPHGRLVIPIGEVRRIEFASRLSDDVRQKIDAAIAELGNTDHAKREAAGEALVKIGPPCYPALLRAGKSSNRDLALSARRLREKFGDAFPEQRLPVHDLDVIHTDDSQIAGRIDLATLKARDAKFGDKTLKITDLVSLHAPGTAPPEQLLAAQPDPGTMTGHAAQTGKSFLFTVTGNTNGSLYGTDIYTTDSTLATVCVHTGVLKVGQTGVVRVTILPGQQAYTTTTRFGVTSSGWAEYSASYKVSRVGDDRK